jgi:hypothetical protein
LNYIVTIKYSNPFLKIGLHDVRNAWYQGTLYFRFPGSGRRISYKQLKKGLIKKQIELLLPLDLCLSENFQSSMNKKSRMAGKPPAWVS